MTRKQVLSFIERRNKSRYQSNLQFSIDAEACGFKVEDLGDIVTAGSTGDGLIYVWTLPNGIGKLVEAEGRLSLQA